MEWENHGPEACSLLAGGPRDHHKPCMSPAQCPPPCPFCSMDLRNPREVRITQRQDLNPSCAEKLSAGFLAPITCGSSRRPCWPWPGHQGPHRSGLTWDSHVWASRILRRLWGWSMRRSRQVSRTGWGTGTQGSSSRRQASWEQQHGAGSRAHQRSWGSSLDPEQGWPSHCPDE